MNRIRKNILLFAMLFGGCYGVFAQTENAVITAIQKEVDRNKAKLKMEDMAPPFFISYSILDRYDYSLSASLGRISNSNEHHQRSGVPRLLVGDYMRNTGRVGGARQFYPTLTSLYDNAGISNTIWRDLDNVYKDAAERYKIYLAILQQQTQTKEEEELPDLEQTKPVNMILQAIPVNIDKTYWEKYLCKASEAAKQYPGILSSNATLNIRNIMTYTYNTEGSRYAVPYTFYQLMFTANTRSGDGQELSHSIWVENATFEQMPDVATFSNQCKTMMENLLKLKEAPVLNETYSGPVLFEDNGVVDIFRQAFFFNNKFNAVPKMVQPNQGGQGYSGIPGNNSQTGSDFELMLNKKVISRSITIKSITGQEFYKGQRLNGYYPVDAEGVVPDKELILIENGVLRNMLNGRKPTQKTRHSNGHTRHDYNSNGLGFGIFPGNILITSNQTFDKKELRKKLLDTAKEEDLEYAYIVKAYAANILIYKIYVADGREELVRGASIADVANLRAFDRILGASDKEQMVSINPIQTTIICPDAILFEAMDITRALNIEFKKPYIVPKPEMSK